MLGLDRQPLGSRLVKLAGLPETLEEVQSELASQCILDYLAVTTTGARSAHLDGPKHGFVDRQSGPCLWHIRIITS